MQKLTISWSGRDFIMEFELNVDSSSDKHKQHVPCPYSRPVSTIITTFNTCWFNVVLNEFDSGSKCFCLQCHRQKSFTKYASCVYLYFSFFFWLNCQTIDDIWFVCTNYNVLKAFVATPRKISRWQFHQNKCVRFNSISQHFTIITD